MSSNNTTAAGELALADWTSGMESIEDYNWGVAAPQTDPSTTRPSEAALQRGVEEDAGDDFTTGEDYWMEDDFLRDISPQNDNIPEGPIGTGEDGNSLSFQAVATMNDMSLIIQRDIEVMAPTNNTFEAHQDENTLTLAPANNVPLHTSTYHHGPFHSNAPIFVAPQQMSQQFSFWPVDVPNSTQTNHYVPTHHNTTAATVLEQTTPQLLHSSSNVPMFPQSNNAFMTTNNVPFGAQRHVAPQATVHPTPLQGFVMPQHRFPTFGNPYPNLDQRQRHARLTNNNNVDSRYQTNAQWNLANHTQADNTGSSAEFDFLYNRYNEHTYPPFQRISTAQAIGISQNPFVAEAAGTPEVQTPGQMPVTTSTIPETTGISSDTSSGTTTQNTALNRDGSKSTASKQKATARKGRGAVQKNIPKSVTSKLQSGEAKREAIMAALREKNAADKAKQQTSAPQRKPAASNTRYVFTLPKAKPFVGPPRPSKEDLRKEQRRKELAEDRRKQAEIKAVRDKIMAAVRSEENQAREARAQARLLNSQTSLEAESPLSGAPSESATPVVNNSGKRVRAAKDSISRHELGNLNAGYQERPSHVARRLARTQARQDREAQQYQQAQQDEQVLQTEVMAEGEDLFAASTTHPGPAPSRIAQTMRNSTQPAMSGLSLTEEELNENFEGGLGPSTLKRNTRSSARRTAAAQKQRDNSTEDAGEKEILDTIEANPRKPKTNTAPQLQAPAPRAPPAQVQAAQSTPAPLHNHHTRSTDEVRAQRIRKLEAEASVMFLPRKRDYKK